MPGAQLMNVAPDPGERGEIEQRDDVEEAPRRGGTDEHEQAVDAGVLVQQLVWQGACSEGNQQREREHDGRSVGCAERHAVREVLEVGAVEVHRELVASLMMKAGLDVWFGDVRVDVHYEHRAVVGTEDVQVIDEELTVLACLRRLEAMRH